MNKVNLNTISLNSSSLNAIGKGAASGASGAEIPRRNILKITYNVDVPAEIKIINSISGLNSMIVDGVETAPSKYYNFNESGEHIVEYVANEDSLTSCNSWFDDNKTVMAADFSSFDTKNIKSFDYMFRYSSVKDVDMSNIDVSALISAESMLAGCKYLKSVKLWKALPLNPVDCSSFFRECNASYFDIVFGSFGKKIKNTGGYLFYYCSKLKKLDLTEFDFRQCTLSAIFTYCRNLETVIFPNGIGIYPLKSLWWAFRDCGTLTALDLSCFDASGLSSFTWSFDGCGKLESFVPFYNWRKGDIDLSYSPISAQNVHDLIDRSMDLADGAEARTLTLNATTKANWEASEYYQTDLELLVTKGITIA